MQIFVLLFDGVPDSCFTSYGRAHNRKIELDQSTSEVYTEATIVQSHLYGLDDLNDFYYAKSALNNKKSL